MSMNSDQVFDKLEELAAISGSNAKQVVVAEAMKDPLFRKVAFLACNSFITFGVTGSATRLGMGTGTFDMINQTVFGELDRLASREVTGGEAGSLLKEWMHRYNRKSNEVLQRILNKDLRCAVTSTILNKVKPGFVPTFEVQLAHKFEEKRILGRIIGAEPKKDGVRVIAIVHDGQCEFFSRTGKPFPAIDHLKNHVVAMVKEAHHNANLFASHELVWYFGTLKALSPCIVFDGEMTSGDFNKTVGDVRRKSVEATDAVFEIFDAIPYKEFQEQEVIEIPARTRRDRLEEIFKYGNPSSSLSLIEHIGPVNTPTQCYELYAEWQSQGFEGAMIKDMTAPYSKKRSHAWLKLKASETEDLYITGLFEGEGKYVGSLGGLIVDFNGVSVRVGGGFSDAERNQLWSDGDNVIGRMIEVQYHEKTKDGSLRHPVFKRFRNDRDDKIAA